MRFVNVNKKKKKKKSTGDDEKTGRVYCVIIFTMGNGVEKKKKKGIRVNSHEDGDIWRETHRCLRISFFPFGKVKVCYYTEES